MRVLDISFPKLMDDRVRSVLEEKSDAAVSLINAQDGECTLRIVVPADEGQDIIDALQTVFPETEDWSIIVLPVEAMLGPNRQEAKDEPVKPKKKSAPREEIYQDVSAGAKPSLDFFLLTILSAIVAAIGINANSVAVVIGAMVIAPLLGPLLAFAFASALGDLELMLRALKTAGLGVATGFITALFVGLLIDIDLNSKELLDRTVIGLDSVALALASGAAAALSVASGLSSALVGVMVAVALLPPSVAIALFLASGEPVMASQACLLLATNVVSVNIASQAMFAFKGIRPRTWLEQRSANTSRKINFIVWGVLLFAIIILIIVGGAR